MAYPSITDRNLTKGIGEMLNYVNEVSSSWVSNMILIGVYVIVLMGVYNYQKDFFEAMAIAGFLTFMIGTLFWLGEFISGITFTIVIAVTIVGFGLLWFTKKSS